ncbi:MAG: hypothetical protein HY255_05280 [Betaproteobacteria bacterium]|nr:hypothetical protein [Betaproteobacteria bacterium]
MNPDDIFLWPDGFWCFRAEFTPEFLRDDTYREIAYLSDEWKWVEANGLPHR